MRRPTRPLALLLAFAACSDDDPAGVTGTPGSFPLTVVVAEGASFPVGSVVSPSVGLRCTDGEECVLDLPANREVVLEHAWPDEYFDRDYSGGSSFGGWSGDCEGFEACALVMDGPKQVVATATEELTGFDLIPYIQGAPYGVSLDIAWNENHQDCHQSVLADGGNEPHECYVQLAPGTALTLTSEESPMTWEGCDEADDTSCQVTVGGDYHTVRATWQFEPPEGFELLHVDYYLKAGGTVYSEGNGIYNQIGIDCGSYDPDENNWGTLCYAVFLEGTTVRLSAEPAPGYEHGGWQGGGCDDVAGASCWVTMTQAQTVVPTFQPVSAGPAGRPGPPASRGPGT